MPFTPVLPRTPPAEVESIVLDMLMEADRLHTPDAPHTTRWMLTRALHWVVENAPGFISGTAHTEANLRHLQRAIMEAGERLLDERDMKVLKAYHALLLDGDDVYVRPVFFESGDELWKFLTEAIKVRHPLDWWSILKICRIYDALTVNCHLLPTIKMNVKPFLEKVMVKWDEFAEDWPYFEELYPRKSMRPILWLSQ